MVLFEWSFLFISFRTTFFFLNNILFYHKRLRWLNALCYLLNKLSCFEVLLINLGIQSSWRCVFCQNQPTFLVIAFINFKWTLTCQFFYLTRQIRVTTLYLTWIVVQVGFICCWAQISFCSLTCGRSCWAWEVLTLRS